MLDVLPSPTVCCDVYHEPLGVVQAAPALATCLPAAHVTVQDALPACADAVAPLFPYPFAVVQAVQDVAPAFDQVFASHTGHVLFDKYDPALQPLTWHRPDTLLVVFGVVPLLLHVGVVQPELLSTALHVTEHVVFSFVLNAVPAPDVVRPPGHAVHVPDVPELYEPVAHWNTFIVSSYVPVLHFGIEFNAGQNDPAGHGCASLYNIVLLVLSQRFDAYFVTP